MKDLFIVYESFFVTTSIEMIKYAIEIKKMTIKGVITHANNISSVFIFIKIQILLLLVVLCVPYFVENILFLIYAINFVPQSLS